MTTIFPVICKLVNLDKVSVVREQSIYRHLSLKKGFSLKICRDGIAISLCSEYSYAFFLVLPPPSPAPIDDISPMFNEQWEPCTVYLPV